MMKSVLSVTLGWALCASVATATDHQAERPNVLFIAIDDLNDWTGMKQSREAKL